MWKPLTLCSGASDSLRSPLGRKRRISSSCAGPELSSSAVFEVQPAARAVIDVRANSKPSARFNMVVHLHVHTKCHCGPEIDLSIFHGLLAVSALIRGRAGPSPIPHLGR